MSPHRPKSGGGDERDMLALADLVADGRSVAAAARRIGMSSFRAQFIWARIVARLGPQAR